LYTGYWFLCDYLDVFRPLQFCFVLFGMFDSTYSVPPPESASNRNFHMDTSNSNDRSALDSFVRQSLSSQGGNNSITSMIGLEPLSPVSSTSAFLLGIHNYKALDDVNLPDFVKEHQATLTFPEKVRNRVWGFLLT
jgi:hypothetical protein